jgi:high-affinity nickel permease
VYSAVLAGLFLGSLIDSLCRTLQKGEFDWRLRNTPKSILFFIIQISINIIIVLLLCRIFPLRFLEWLQLTISGSLFATVLFITQQNLVNNALRIFYFQSQDDQIYSKKK